MDANKRECFQGLEELTADGLGYRLVESAEELCEEIRSLMANAPLKV